MISALEIAKRYVGVRETGGKNRGPEIDQFNMFAGVPLGSPYCASGISFCFDLARRKLQGAAVRNHPAPSSVVFPRTASSQQIRLAFKKAGLLSTDAQDLKSWKGGVFGWTNRDKVHGHVGLVAGRLTDASGRIVALRTVEFNSNSAGSRDGEGVVENERIVPVDRGHKLWFCDVSSMAGGDFGWGELG
jgi:hypothetical protein